ncbi:Speckle-type POZ protein like [Argiope bruennichi]|uniref:Speckle-type POZ protein like n=2 Tax=Argiope bruennichi TaxID=94029 RepID=A0A8T0EUQ6_ARGBR|nr:Speckle-type POZ protein like [Argiope bruennichi]
MDEIISNKKDLYLPKDILTVRCKFWIGEHNAIKVEPICARTRIGVEHISFLHVIENFSTLRTNLKKTVHIPFHSKNKKGISNSVYCSGGVRCEEKIMFQITSDPNQILFKYKVSLLDSSGNIIKCTDEDNRFDGNRKEIGHFPLSLSKDAIICKKRYYLPDDRLSLLCEYAFTTGIEFQKIEGIESETIVTNIEQLRNYSHIKEKLLACPSALAELKDFYSNKYLTDVELKTETNSFPAHKIVLCARSPVFKAMMDNDMKEKNSKSIQVDDLEDDTVQKLLFFLYSDSLENVSWETAIKVYYAADKYQIEKLKLMCSSFLIENLTVSTATELLILADTHNDCDLKKITEDFILEYDEQIFSAEKWGELLETNLQLAASTMHLKYKTKK